MFLSGGNKFCKEELNFINLVENIMIITDIAPKSREKINFLSKISFNFIKANSLENLSHYLIYFKILQALFLPKGESEAV